MLDVYGEDCDISCVTTIFGLDASGQATVASPGWQTSAYPLHHSPVETARWCKSPLRYSPVETVRCCKSPLPLQRRRFPWLFCPSRPGPGRLVGRARRAWRPTFETSLLRPRRAGDASLATGSAPRSSTLLSCFYEHRGKGGKGEKRRGEEKSGKKEGRVRGRGGRYIYIKENGRWGWEEMRRGEGGRGKGERGAVWVEVWGDEGNIL